MESKLCFQLYLNVKYNKLDYFWKGIWQQYKIESENNMQVFQNTNCNLPRQIILHRKHEWFTFEKNPPPHTIVSTRKHCIVSLAYFLNSVNFNTTSTFKARKRGERGWWNFQQETYVNFVCIFNFNSSSFRCISARSGSFKQNCKVSHISSYFNAKRQTNFQTLHNLK